MDECHHRGSGRRVLPAAHSMSREAIGRLNEQDFPQLVGLAVPRGGSQDRDLEFDAFTASMAPGSRHWSPG